MAGCRNGRLTNKNLIGIYGGSKCFGKITCAVGCTQNRIYSIFCGLDISRKKQSVQAFGNLVVSGVLVKLQAARLVNNKLRSIVSLEGMMLEFQQRS